MNQLFLGNNRILLFRPNGGQAPTPVARAETRIWWSSDENDYDDYLIEDSINYENLIAFGLMPEGSGTYVEPYWTRQPYKVEIGIGSQEHPLTIIDDNTFFKCASLISVTIPDGVTSINQAFTECRELTSVIISSSVTNIQSYAFYNCSGLKNVVFNGFDNSTVKSMIRDNKIFGSYFIDQSWTPINVTFRINCIIDDSSFDVTFGADETITFIDL